MKDLVMGAQPLRGGTQLCALKIFCSYCCNCLEILVKAEINYSPDAHHYIAILEASRLLTVYIITLYICTYVCIYGDKYLKLNII